MTNRSIAALTSHKTKPPIHMCLLILFCKYWNL